MVASATVRGSNREWKDALCIVDVVVVVGVAVVVVRRTVLCREGLDDGVVVVVDGRRPGADTLGHQATDT